MSSVRCSIANTGKALTIALVAIALLLCSQRAFAAIGCTLSNPAEDLKYLFPAMTTYKEDSKDFPRLADGVATFAAFKLRVGSQLDPIYETYDTPYTVYSVFTGDTKIGIVHGVNVPGRGGVIQVFLSTDPSTGEIKKFFFQRLESPAAQQLRAPTFRTQFDGMSLADFYKHDYYAAADPTAAADKIAHLTVPTLDPTSRLDYDATLRGIRKNLVLLDFFVYQRRNDPFFARAQEAIARKRAP